MEMENDGYFEPIAPYSTYSELHLGFSGWACSSREILIMQGMPCLWKNVRWLYVSHNY